MSEKNIVLKNTVFLFFRMIILLFIGLYTSRVVLDALGVVDYGLYSLVGSVVAFFTIINNSVSASVQRYFNININNISKMRDYYKTSNKVFFVIAVSVVATGLVLSYFYANRLHVPEAKHEEMYILIYVSLLSLFFQIIRIPDFSIITSYEKMHVIAYVSMLEAFLKLFASLLLVRFNGDYLVIYSCLMLVVVVFVNIVYRFYIKRSHADLFFDSNYSIKKAKRILSFSGWSLLGSSGVVVSQQSTAIIINKYFALIFNATNSLANQIYTVVFGFVSSFQLAYTPLLMRTYNSGDINKCANYVVDFTRYSLYLSLVVVLPILVFVDDFLKVWLVQIPPKTAEVTQIYLLILLFDVLSAPLWIIANAHGNMARYQVIIFILNIITIPLSIFMLTEFEYVITVFLVKFMVSVLIYVYRLIYVKSLIGIDLGRYLLKCLLVPVLIVVFNFYLGFFYIKDLMFFSDDVLNKVWAVIIFMSMLVLGIFIFGINSVERLNVFHKLKYFWNRV